MPDRHEGVAHPLLATVVDVSRARELPTALGLERADAAPLHHRLRDGLLELLQHRDRYATAHHERLAVADRDVKQLADPRQPPHADHDHDRDDRQGEHRCHI